MPADLPRSLIPGQARRDWQTVRYARRLLVVVHNVTAATRLLDVLPLITEDRRVQTYYTCPGSSAFTAGTEEFLAERALPTISWRHATQWKFDAAIAASHGGPLHKLGKRLIILPHGMGYNKLLKPETGNRKPETGNRQAGSGFRTRRGLVVAHGQADPVRAGALACRTAATAGAILPRGIAGRADRR